MIKVKRTDSANVDFIHLVNDLDRYLALKDGEEHSYYDQFNSIKTLKNCVVIYKNEEAIGCGAIKKYEENIAEVKRMFVKPAFRGKGYASQILGELEAWAKELNCTEVILETGKRQTEAIILYSKTYSVLTNYGQYAGMENSICFKKILS